MSLWHQNCPCNHQGTSSMSEILPVENGMETLQEEDLVKGLDSSHTWKSLRVIHELVMSSCARAISCLLPQKRIQLSEPGTWLRML